MKIRPVEDDLFHAADRQRQEANSRFSYFR